MAMPHTRRLEPGSDELTTLRNTIRGRVLTADGTHDTARSLHNGMVDRHPAAIFSAEALRTSGVLVFGLTSELPVSIRGGGHADRRIRGLR